jgi:hypothetical protein
MSALHIACRSSRGSGRNRMPPSAAAYAPLERDGEPGHADAPTDGSVAAPEAEAPLGPAGTDEPAQLEPSEVAEQPMEADGTGGGSSDVAAATTQELGSKTVEQVVGIAAATLRKHSLPRVHFTVGVLNALFKAFVLGAFPQKFWLYTAAQFPPLMAMLIPRWRAKSRLLYFAELCWVLNFSGWLFFMTEAATLCTGTPMLPVSARLLACRAFFCLANGPLAGTVLMNHNAIVFHDIERTGSFFIHFSPAVVTWTMRWRPEGADLLAIDASRAAAHTAEGTSYDLIVTAMGAYFCWWGVYTVPTVRTTQHNPTCCVQTATTSLTT